MRLLISTVIVYFFASVAFASDVYTWDDDNGVMHFSDNPSNAPAKRKLKKIESVNIANQNTCTNPWGGSQKSSTPPEPKQVKLCLPKGFAETETEHGGVVFKDIEGTSAIRLSISKDNSYHASEDIKQYKKLEEWLVKLASTPSENKNSSKISSEITRIDSKLFVRLKGVIKNLPTESYIHTGDGYLLALSAESPSDDKLSELRSVIKNAEMGL